MCTCRLRQHLLLHLPPATRSLPARSAQRGAIWQALLRREELKLVPETYSRGTVEQLHRGAGNPRNLSQS